MSRSLFKNNVTLADHTTFRLGGPARSLCIASSADEVMMAIDEARGKGMHWQLIGHGSNILASDKGFDGAVISYRDDTPPVMNESGNISVSGGQSLSSLIEFMADAGKGGLQNLTGIPGTVGGAIAGNAGAYGTPISDKVESCLILGRDGNVRSIHREDLKFEYRWSSIKEDAQVILKATFSADDMDPAEIRRTMDERLADRTRKHPNPNLVSTAGSFFKNPMGNDGRRIAAGKLLDQAGCGQLRVGGATLWETHANIIIVDNGATTADVKKLADEMISKVGESCGIELSPEVFFLGH